MDYRFEEGKLLVSRTKDEQAPILNRLRRIEGQVRGLIQMVENDRYCLDEIQVSNAIVAAVKAVSLLILSSHLQAGIRHAMPSGDENEALFTELTSVLQAALKNN